MNIYGKPSRLGDKERELDIKESLEQGRSVLIANQLASFFVVSHAEGRTNIDAPDTISDIVDRLVREEPDILQMFDTAMESRKKEMTLTQSAIAEYHSSDILPDEDLLESLIADKQYLEDQLIKLEAAKKMSDDRKRLQRKFEITRQQHSESAF